MFKKKNFTDNVHEQYTVLVQMLNNIFSFIKKINNGAGTEVARRPTQERICKKSSLSCCVLFLDSVYWHT